MSYDWYSYPTNQQPSDQGFQPGAQATQPFQEPFPQPQYPQHDRQPAENPFIPATPNVAPPNQYYPTPSHPANPPNSGMRPEYYNPPEPPTSTDEENEPPLLEGISASLMNQSLESISSKSGRKRMQSYTPPLRSTVLQLLTPRSLDGRHRPSRAPSLCNCPRNIPPHVWKGSLRLYLCIRRPRLCIALLVRTGLIPRLLNLMVPTKSIRMSQIVSVLGYCLLPLALLAFVSIVITLNGMFGFVLSSRLFPPHLRSGCSGLVHAQCFPDIC